jgi:phage baseplate assembly protein W
MTFPHVGRGWAFPPHVGDRNRISTVQGDTDIKQAIYIILNTARGERVMRPEFGCDIHDMIFAPANHQTAMVIERQVTEALGRWEPRIRLITVRAMPTYADYGEMVIEITYEIKDAHDVRSLVFPFYLTPA